MGNPRRCSNCLRWSLHTRIHPRTHRPLCVLCEVGPGPVIEAERSIDRDIGTFVHEEEE